MSFLEQSDLTQTFRKQGKPLWIWGDTNIQPLATPQENREWKRKQYLKATGWEFCKSEKDTSSYIQEYEL